MTTIGDPGDVQHVDVRDVRHPEAVETPSQERFVAAYAARLRS
jgi:hypothetical protein